MKRKKHLTMLFGIATWFSLVAQCPSANFTTTAPACNSSLVNFTNTSGNVGLGWSYFWDFDYPNGGGASPATSTAQNPTGINYSPGGNGVYTVLLTISNGTCSSSVLLDIDIRTARANFLSPVSSICVGDSVLFSNTGTLGSSPFANVVHSWSFGAGAFPSTSNAVNPPPVKYSTPGAKTITHLVTVNYGACGGGTRQDLVSQNIIVNPAPTPSFTSNAPICQDVPVNFVYNGGGGVTYEWDFGQNSSPQNSTAGNPSGIIYSAAGTKTITLTALNSFGCSSTYTNTIAINAAPSVSAGKDTVICANTSVQIGSSPQAGYVYSWIPTATLTLNNATIADPIASPIAPVTIYSVSMTNTLTGCNAKASVVVTMLQPIVANAGVDGVICRNDSVQIGTGLVNGQIYSWAPTSGLSDSLISNPVCSPSVTTVYTVTVGRANCAVVKDEVTVTVHQLPKIYAGKDDTITVGSQIQLIATGGVQYNWSPSYGLDNVGVFNPVASPSVTSAYIVKGIDIYGCINYDTINVIVIAPNFWLPNAFTPNGDNFNDILIVRGEGISNFEFGIYTKWGEQVFYTKDQKAGWDGHKQATEDAMPEGVYVYFIKGTKSNGDPINSKGLINLIR